ncbi:MAG: hypothetical protein H6925_04350 [Holosporaceae bacterium]|nr:MAG: hypothetical protein H6925_04350 [Holosporaceae bacterium]
MGPTSYIDFGSDLGWFVKQFTNMGFDAYGLDRDEPANQIACHKTGVPADKIITQELVAGLDEFIREGRTFDCTSCLSVLHHFVRQIRGNEGTSADETLSKLAQVTGRVMFYDMGQDHEKVKGFTPAYIQSWLQEKGRFREVIALGVDTDNVGKYRHAYKRTLFACLK